MFKQVEIPGKGQGLVATAKLPVGTTVIEESPILIAEKNEDVLFPFNMQQVINNFRRLTDKQKNQVLSLNDPGPNSPLGKKLPSVLAHGTDPKVLRIFAGNCILLCAHPEMNVNKSGLYMTISRINHSCAPNVVWSWLLKDKSRSVKQLRVIREIKEGEEILASYLVDGNRFPSRGERQMKLRATWNFTCNCEVCSLTGEELKKNEDGRRKIQELHDAIPIKASIDQNELALKDAKEKLKVLKSMKKEMILYILAALMECCELAAHCKLPSSSYAELMKKAKEMSELNGDVAVYFYNAKEKKIRKEERRNGFHVKTTDA